MKAAGILSNWEDVKKTALEHFQDTLYDLNRGNDPNNKYLVTLENYGKEKEVNRDTYVLGLSHGVLACSTELSKLCLTVSDELAARIWEANRDQTIDDMLQTGSDVFEAIPKTEGEAMRPEEIEEVLAEMHGERVLSADQIRMCCQRLRELGLVEVSWRDTEGRGGKPWVYYRAGYPTSFDKAMIKATEALFRAALNTFNSN